MDYSIEHLIQEELVAHVDQGADQTQVETGDGTTVSPMDVAIEQSDMTDPDENTDGHHQTVTQTDDPIHQYDNPNEQTQDIASQAVEKPEQKVFRMEIITPAGSTRYQWDRLDGGPVVIRGLPMIRIAEFDEELEKNPITDLVARATYPGLTTAYKFYTDYGYIPQLTIDHPPSKGAFLLPEYNADKTIKRMVKWAWVKLTNDEVRELEKNPNWILKKAQTSPTFVGLTWK